MQLACRFSDAPIAAGIGRSDRPPATIGRSAFGNAAFKAGTSMVTIEIEYTGDLRCSARHTPSQTQLITDAPVDNQGKGESFSPTDLVATALGTCMATLMGIFAQRHAIDLTGMKVTVVKE